jgi:hypothetical protein
MRASDPPTAACMPEEAREVLSGDLSCGRCRSHLGVAFVLAHPIKTPDPNDDLGSERT